MKFEFRGKTYKSRDDAMAAFHITSSLVYTRVKNGESFEDAFAHCVERKELRGRDGNKHEVVMSDGTKYESIRALAEEYDVCYQWLVQLLERGMTPEDAIKKCLDSKARKRTYIGPDGVEYKSMRSMAKAFGISHGQMSNLILQGMEPADAVNKILSHKVKGPDGVTYDTLRAAANHFNCSYSYAYSLVSNGMKAEDAIMAAIAKRENDKNPKNIEKPKPLARNFSENSIEGPDGKMYHSLYAMANELEISYNTLLKKSGEGAPAKEIAKALLEEKENGVDRRRGKNYMLLGPDGNYYKSVAELAKKYDCTKSILRSYLRQGMSAEDAIAAAANDYKSASRQNKDDEQ